MANPILITGAAGRVGVVGRTVTELLLKQGKAVRAMVRNEDQRAQALRRLGECHFRSESINSHFPHISSTRPKKMRISIEIWVFYLAKFKYSGR